MERNVSDKEPECSPASTSPIATEPKRFGYRLADSLNDWPCCSFLDKSPAICLSGLFEVTQGRNPVVLSAVVMCAISIACPGSKPREEDDSNCSKNKIGRA